MTGNLEAGAAARGRIGLVAVAHMGRIAVAAEDIEVVASHIVAEDNVFAVDRILYMLQILFVLQVRHTLGAYHIAAVPHNLEVLRILGGQRIVVAVDMGCTDLRGRHTPGVQLTGRRHRRRLAVADRSVGPLS